MEVKEKAIRHNENKLRYDLVDAFAHKKMVEVLTEGAKEYGDNNWRKGFQWLDVIASMKRHIEAYLQGEDYDEKTGKLPFESMDKSTIDEKWFKGDGYSPRGKEIVSAIDKYVSDIKKVLGNDVKYIPFIKEIEKKTNHDVKAIEYFLKEKFDQND